MGRLWKLAVLVLGAADLLLIGTIVHSSRTLEQTRHELQSVAKDNLYLRETLGNLAVTVNLKDEEIDDLEKSECMTPGAVPHALDPKKSALKPR